MTDLPFTPLPTASYAWQGNTVFSHPYRCDVPGRCAISGSQVENVVKRLGLKVVLGEPPMPVLLPAVCETTLAERRQATRALRRWYGRQEALNFHAMKAEHVLPEGRAIVLPGKTAPLMLSAPQIAGLLPAHTGPFVAFSGGKDSTALALLMPFATPVFTDTGWEFDEVYAHIEKFERVTGRKVVRVTRADGFTLPEYIRHAAYMPGHGSRFCTRMFKIEPYNEFIRKYLPAQLCIGLRADESPDDRVGNLSEIEGLTIRYPLREKGLGLNDVIRICVEHDLLPRNPVYMARGGCKGCFYKRKAEIKAMAALVPAVMDELQAIENEVQDERGRFAFMFPNAGASITAIRSQQLLFEPAEVYRQAADKSDMGANCGLFCNR